MTIRSLCIRNATQTSVEIYWQEKRYAEVMIAVLKLSFFYIVLTEVE